MRHFQLYVYNCMSVGCAHERIYECVIIYMHCFYFKSKGSLHRNMFVNKNKKFF